MLSLKPLPHVHVLLEGFHWGNIVIEVLHVHERCSRSLVQGKRMQPRCVVISHWNSRLRMIDGGRDVYEGWIESMPDRLLTAWRLICNRDPETYRDNSVSENMRQNGFISYPPPPLLQVHPQPSLQSPTS